MREFIGRGNELHLLQERWRSSQSEFLVLYGRRRVGKTELIRHLARRKRTLFAVGSRSDARSQIHHFAAELAQLSQEPDLARLPIHDWDTLFGRLNTVFQKARGKTLFVLDEFPWMAQASPELPSLLQKWWDAHWSKNGKVFLILCGSYFGFMEREVLAQKSPLFGRRTAVLQLKPLPFEDSRQFHPGLSLKEQAKRHLLCGGIPAYHKMFGSNAGFPEQLISAFFEPDAPLAKEADFLLMEELKEPKLYFSLLESLGASRKGISELASALGVERSRLPYYTKNLMDLHYVQKWTPLLTYPALFERKSVYRIADPLLRFWFTFVYPNASVLERLEARVFFATMVDPHLDAYWGTAFEPLAADLFLRKKMFPRLAEHFKVGSYWDKHIQIDFVIALKSGLSYLGETKWNKLDKSTVLGFVQKLQSLQGNLSYQPVIISAEPVPASIKALPSCRTYSLKELV